MDKTRLLKACLNGLRTKSEHPAVPITPAELAGAASGEHRGAMRPHSWITASRIDACARS